MVAFDGVGVTAALGGLLTAVGSLLYADLRGKASLRPGAALFMGVLSILLGVAFVLGADRSNALSVFAAVALISYGAGLLLMRLWWDRGGSIAE